MTFFGTGLRLGLGTSLYFLAAVVVDRLTRPAFSMDPIARQWLWGLAAGFILAAACIYIIGYRQIRAALRKRTLCTTGLYRFSRHPLYAAHILLTTPSVCLLFHSWLVLTTPFFMYLLFRLLIGREESALASTFGDEYLRWRDRTPLLIPRPRL